MQALHPLPTLDFLPIDLLRLILRRDYRALPVLRATCRNLRRVLEKDWNRYRCRIPITKKEKTKYILEVMSRSVVGGFVWLPSSLLNRDYTVDGCSLRWKQGDDRTPSHWVASCVGEMSAVKRDVALDFLRNNLASIAHHWEVPATASMTILHERGLTPKQAALLLTRELDNAMRNLTHMSLKEYLCRGQNAPNGRNNPPLHLYLRRKLGRDVTRDECVSAVHSYVERLAKVRMNDKW